MWMFNHLIVNDGVLIHFISFAIFVDKEITFLHQWNQQQLRHASIDFSGFETKTNPQTIFCEQEIPYNFWEINYSNEVQCSQWKFHSLMEKRWKWKYQSKMHDYRIESITEIDLH